MKMDRAFFLRGLMASYVLLALGCGEPEIDSYTVRRIESTIPAAASTNAPLTSPPAADVPQKMLGGILLTGKQAWFFKVTAEPETISKQEVAFRTWLESVRINASGEPTWDLPADWQQLPGNAFRFATIRMGGTENSPELSISQLPQGDQEDDYLLANINRWRNQLQLAPWKLDEMNKEITSVQAGDQTIRLVVLEGTAGGGGMSAPFAGGRTAPPNAPFAGQPPGPKQPPREAPLPEVAPPSNADMKFTVPGGWEQIKPPSSIQRLAFRVKSDEELLEITVTQLGGAAGGMLPNINRWRGQLQLAPIDEAELATAVQKIATADGEASLVKIVDTSEPARAIFVVVISQPDATWFIKAQGPAELAEKEAEHLQEFVKSLQLP